MYGSIQTVFGKHRAMVSTNPARCF